MTRAKAVRVVISGRVQGVGFRYWVQNTARDLGISGWVRNRRDGSVEAVYSGVSADLDWMIDRSRRGPTHALVDDLQQFEWQETVADGFLILSTV